MDPLTIGWVGMIALFGLIVLKVPIGVAMMIVGVAGFALQTNWTSAGTLLASEPSNLLASVDMATLPLFLLMGTFANAAGFSADIYAVAASFLGHRRGGLAYATIGGCAAFGAGAGSSTATAATFAKIALPEMRRRNYSPSFAAGAIAAGGTLKALIPPSLIMILYCIIAQTFIYRPVRRGNHSGADHHRPQSHHCEHRGAPQPVGCADHRAPAVGCTPCRHPQGHAGLGADARGVRRSLQRCVHRQRGGVRCCSARLRVRAAAQAAADRRPAGRSVRKRARQRDALRGADGRLGFHLFHHAGSRPGTRRSRRSPRCTCLRLPSFS